MTEPIRIKDIMDNERRRRQYDYTETEDRLRLKLDTLRDKLRDLTSAELKELESGLDAFTRMAELLLKRHRVQSTDEPPAPTVTSHKNRTAPHGQSETFGSLCDKGKNPMPLGGG